MNNKMSKALQLEDSMEARESNIMEIMIRIIKNEIFSLKNELENCDGSGQLNDKVDIVNQDRDIKTCCNEKSFESVACSNQFENNNQVINFVDPGDLESILADDLKIYSSACQNSHLEKICYLVIKYSVKTNHRYFFNQLYHGVDPFGLAGSWLSEALHTNCYTFEVAPVFNVIEKDLLRWTMEKFGWKSSLTNNVVEGDGILSPGGSISNMYGMVLARHKKMPSLKSLGFFGVTAFVAFTSDQSHYSLSKSANWLGLGLDHVVRIKTDEMGRMLVANLVQAIEHCIEDGRTPFFVNATAGSTVLGAFDDILSIAEVCVRFKLWLHVDGCWGGSFIMSRTLRNKYLAGIEKADSIAWNPHKMLGAPLQSSIFITKHKQLLYDCNSASASYLFQQDKFYDVNYDTGDKSIQCGRKTDAFKIWFMLKARGELYFTEQVENAYDKAIYFDRLIRSTEGFEPIMDVVQCTNVCFQYIPPKMRKRSIRSQEWWKDLNLVAPRIKEAMIRQGTMMISYQSLDPKIPRGNFFRMVVGTYPRATNKDMDFVIGEIDRIGSCL